MTTIPAQYHIERAPLLTGRSEAVFSADKIYRYRLTRIWNTKPWGTDADYALFVMLNPSTADAFRSDPTVTRCERFAKAWGLDGLIVANLFALRSTDPQALLRPGDPVGQDNDKFIFGAAVHANVVVAAWGAHRVAAARAAEVTGFLPADRTKCLGVTKGGYPKHPLYVPAATQLVPYPGPRS